ncbi:MAG: hemolysin family protein, partial [Planctomycetes bacterium]|nr:hemolysin family protein [Planctomycetota bacterium]
MDALLSYEHFWLVVSLAFIASGLFISICRKATERFSRKALLERSVDWSQERVERFARFKEDYEGTLGNLDIVLRCVISCCMLLDGLPEEGFRLGPETALLLGGLVLKIAAVQILVLELLASIIGRLWPEAWLARFSRLIRFLHSCFAPARWLLEGVLRPLAQIFGRSSHRDSASILEEELLSKAEEGEREGLLESEEIDMIESIISFGDVSVSEVMTPRTEMICLDLEDSLDSNLEQAIESGLSRIPVYSASKDNIVGILYVKDLLKSLYGKEDIRLEAIVRSPYRVSGSKKIDDLLQEFKQHRLHIAIVLDEHGGTDGLVTIEDVIEEIVGEISDEYEQQ